MCQVCGLEENHCRETQYTFQIRKCNDSTCCAPKQIKEDKLVWLPEPELDETWEYFLPYEEATNKETTEKDRPSLQRAKKATSEPRQGNSSPMTEEPVEIEKVDQLSDNQGTAAEQGQVGNSWTKAITVPLSTQNAHVAICVECRNPQVVYSKTKLRQRKEV